MGVVARGPGCPAAGETAGILCALARGGSGAAAAAEAAAAQQRELSGAFASTSASARPGGAANGGSRLGFHEGRPPPAALLVQVGAQAHLAALLGDGPGDEAGFYAAGALTEIARWDAAAVEACGGFEACADALCDPQVRAHTSSRELRRQPGMDTLILRLGQFAFLLIGTPRPALDSPPPSARPRCPFLATPTVRCRFSRTSWSSLSALRLSPPAPSASRRPWAPTGTSLRRWWLCSGPGRRRSTVPRLPGPSGARGWRDWIASTYFPSLLRLLCFASHKKTYATCALECCALVQVIAPAAPD